MRSFSKSLLPTLLVILCTLFALGDHALAQASDGRRRTPTGVPPSSLKKKHLIKGKFKNELERQKEQETFAPREILIRLGDRVRGRTGKGITHRVLFEAVKGTRINLSLVPADRKLTLASRLLGPDNAALSALKPKKSDPAILNLNDFVLGKTGLFAVEVAFAGAVAGDYLLETAGRFPDALNQEFRLIDGRPQGITFGGMSDRSIQEVKVVVLDRADLRIALNLVDPAGKNLLIDATTWRSTDGRTIIVRNVPVDAVGDFKLFVMDQNRDKGKARISVSFKNPKPAKKTHEL